VGGRKSYNGIIDHHSTTLLSSVGKPSHLWKNWLFLLDDEWLDIYQHLAKRWITLLSNIG